MAPRPIARHGDHRYVLSISELVGEVDKAGVRSDAGERELGKSQSLYTWETDGKVVGRREWMRTCQRE